MTSLTQEFLDDELPLYYRALRSLTGELPTIRFGNKVGRNARAVRTMFRHPVGRVVDSAGRTRAYWELTDPLQPRTPLMPVPVKRSRRSR